MPHLSVVIPAHNSEETIEACLKAIKKSVYHDYELIVVDDGSSDKTRFIAEKYADNLIGYSKNLGRIHARISGFKAAKGEIIVNIDSDVVVKADTLTKIADYFSEHREIDALTGLLAKEHHNQNFFSQYKNLYMHYIFSKLPEKITFLYGSIYAIRHNLTKIFASNVKIADDTALGQELTVLGKKIAFLKNIEVIHLKRYGLFSFIKNDFQIPFDWAKIFVTYKGWMQLGKNKAGFLHSSKEQLASIILAPLIGFLFFITVFSDSLLSPILLLILLWSLLNLRFIIFLIKEKGIFFGMLAFFVIFIDNIVMACGILCGFISFIMPKKRVHVKVIC